MEVNVYFPGGKRVYADYGGFTIETDQPAIGGGDGSAPAPFDLFLVSIGTCAGIYALNFMQQRAIDPEGARISMRTHPGRERGLIGKIDLELQLPAGFPEKYRNAIANAMNFCAVKKHLHQPPAFEITTVPPPVTEWQRRASTTVETLKRRGAPRRERPAPLS
jgi:ribosomal protein S12 methylthiotransferase accessory factor